MNIALSYLNALRLGKLGDEKNGSYKIGRWEMNPLYWHMAMSRDSLCLFKYIYVENGTKLELDI
jgi:hypothetical protein